MKTLFRILVILVVASLIGGAIFAMANVSGSASQRSSPQRPEGDRSRADRSNGISLLFGMFGNLAIISIIAAVYLNIGKRFEKMRQGTK